MKSADITKTTADRGRSGKRDWKRFDAMSAVERARAARADPDAQPLSDSDMARMKRTPLAKIVRRALALTQEEFAARYGIPLGTLRDWEQGRTEPDQPARSYLTVIATDPEGVFRALSEQRPPAE